MSSPSSPPPPGPLAGLLVADFIYLEPRTAGIGFAIALFGLPVYWLRSLTSRANKPEAEPLGVND